MSEIDFPEATVPPADGHAMIVPAPTKPLEVARLFVEKHYDDPRGVRLLHHRALFYVWRESHWPELEEGSVRSDLYRWLEHAEYVKETRTGITIVPFDPSKGRVTNVVDALEAIVHVGERVEAPAWLTDDGISEEIVAMQNGLLAHSARELHPHTPRFFNEYVLPFAFDPNAPEPTRWQQFLRELWDNDQQSIDTLQEIMGYLLVGDTAQHKIFMLVGPKRTGKGTILRVLTALLGVENVAAPDLVVAGDELRAAAARRQAARGDLRRAPGLTQRRARRGRAAAVDLRRRLDHDRPQVQRPVDRPATDAVPGADERAAPVHRRLGRARVEVRDPHAEQLLLRPRGPGADRRTASRGAGDLQLVPGRARPAHRRGYFVQPDAARSALQHLEDLASPVSAFVRDRCRIDAEAHVEKDELWKAWRNWCTDEGTHPGTKAVFVRDLRAAVPGATPGRLGPRGDRVHVIRGISLPGDETAAATPATPDTDIDIDRVSGVSGSKPLLHTPTTATGVLGGTPP